MVRTYLFDALVNTDSETSSSEADLLCTEEDLKALKFPMREARPYLTANETEILERQAIFSDLLEEDTVLAFFTAAYEKAQLLSDFLDKIGYLADGENEALLYSLKELVLFTEAMDLLADRCDGIKVESLKSGRLRAWITTVRALSEDEQYLAIKKWLEGYSESLRNIHSLTLGVNLDAQMNVKEVGIVSFNTESYVNSSVLDKILRNYDPPKEYTCLVPLGIRNLGITAQTALHIDKEFYAGMNRVVKNSIRGIKRYLTDSLQRTLDSFASRKEELAFFFKGTLYIQNLKHAGLPIVFPKLDCKNYFTRLYNPLLLDHCFAHRIIPSSVTMDEQQRIFLLTGPNSGGKTVFVQSLGLAQLFFQLGLPVTAEEAAMQPYDRIITHFIEASYKPTESRLANETVRLKESLNKIKGRSLLLLDETFSGTNVYDALFLAEALVKYLSSRSNCYAIYITHIHELNERLEALRQTAPYTCIRLMAAGIKDRRRTYEIVPYTGEHVSSGFARDVVMENGLGFLFGDS